jgi:metal-responsive CopG/Arc/MetJ family transcriptional regulator
MSKKRITLDLDESLLNAIDGKAVELQKSRSQFLTDSVQKMLKGLDRERIDAAFALMAEDPQYQDELAAIEQEMAPASNAAWRLLDAAEQRTDQ